MPGPDCPCTDVALDFVAADDDSVEHLVVDLATGEPDDSGGGDAALRPWRTFREDPVHLAELEARRSAARRVARELR